VTIGVHRSDQSRHLVLRLSAGETIPRAIAAVLEDEHVTCGWLRGSGVLVDVELRAFDAELSTLGSVRRIAGPVHVVALEGSIGLSNGLPSLSLHAVVARDTDRGLETLAGEIASARTVGLEVFVTALDDVAVEGSQDAAAGVWLIGAPSGAAPARPAPAAGGRPPSPGGWPAAVTASERSDREARPRPALGPSVQPTLAVPPRRPRPEPEADAPTPEPGDVVDHFAFGGCDVVKSDGDRLHLRLHKDGRIREIALAMLRVLRLPDTDDGKRRFRLERRM
jgi:predicted DNA-binding protein with PD1-like motif